MDFRSKTALMASLLASLWLTGCTDGVMVLPNGTGGSLGGSGSGSSGLVITRANIDPSTVRVSPGQSLTLSVETSNPNGGSLYYSWSASGGSFSSTSGNPVRWTAPGNAGRVRVVVYVNNGRETTQAEFGFNVQ